MCILGRVSEQVDRLNELRASGVPLLRVKMPPHYRSLVDEEIRILGREGRPLFLVVYPGEGRFDTFAPGEVVNFVEDFDHMPPGLRRVVVHRYPYKLLYFPTDMGVGHCQYCFRPDVTGPDARQKNLNRNLSPETICDVTDYLRQHPDVREVIFSGGDPLACRVKDLERAAASFRRVPSVRWLRLHTKAPIFNPSLVTDAFLDLCARHICAHATRSGSSSTSFTPTS